VRELQAIGFRRIALGGMVPLKSHEILAALAAVDAVRAPETGLHLLGISRVDHVERFAGYGVVSFDSTSPLRRAFKDDKENYFTLDRTYTAVRVPQVEGNPKLQRAIVAGQVRQPEARRLERACLDALERYDAERCPLEPVLDVLEEYEHLYAGSSTRRAAYREVLGDRPRAPATSAATSACTSSSSAARNATAAAASTTCTSSTSGCAASSGAAGSRVRLPTSLRVRPPPTPSLMLG
jgi:hypothetical protein